jgi:hypothetical protein
MMIAFHGTETLKVSEVPFDLLAVGCVAIEGEDGESTRMNRSDSSLEAILPVRAEVSTTT